MFKPSYSVVTSVLVVFALLAFMRHTFIGFIPRTTNKLATSHQKFLATASHQEIVWHLLDEDAFAEARRSDKPILLVVGLSSTRLGTDFDRKAFEDADTARYVSQHFFCIRIDGYEHPEWLNAILPISRLRVGLDPEFQAWIMDPKDHVLSLIGRTFEGPDVDYRSLYRSVVEARNQYELVRPRQSRSQTPLDLQTDDLFRLASLSGKGQLSLSGYANFLGTAIDPKFGGLPEGKVQRLHPNAWRFMTLCGYSNLWNASVTPILFSKLVDVQDGGFFRAGFPRSFDEVEMGKNSVENAEMMEALALQGQISDDSLSVKLAESSFDWLVSSAQINSFIPACQDDDETPQGRSDRLSFPTWRLHDVLSAADRDWANEMLGLKPGKNKQMLPYLVSRNTIFDDQSQFNRVIGLMKSSTTHDAPYNDSGYLDANGNSLAKMLRVARMWDDNDRLEAVQPLYHKLKDFQRDGDLLHEFGSQDRPHAYLGDYLALADVDLQQFLATGQTRPLEEGLRTLRSALKMFRGRRPWELNVSRDSTDVAGIASFCVPQIADSTGESCTAQAIRLESSYGRLLADTSDGKELIALAELTMRSFADLAGRGGIMTAGYFCEAAEILDGRFAVAIGPNAREMADKLFRQVPTRFIAPATGIVRRDLQHRQPGIYVIGNGIQGPMSVEAAVDLLPVTLSSRAAR